MLIALDLDTGIRFEYTLPSYLQEDTRILVYPKTERFIARGHLSHQARMFVWNDRNGEPKCMPYVLELWKRIRAFEAETGCIHTDLTTRERKNLSARIHRTLMPGFKGTGKHLRDI